MQVQILMRFHNNEISIGMQYRNAGPKNFAV